MAPILAKDGSVLQNGDLEEFLEKNLKEAKVIDKPKTSASLPLVDRSILGPIRAKKEI